jgi:ribosome-binding factor A
MHREVAEIIEHRLRDPRLGTMVSVTDVEVSRDLSFARIFVSVLAEGDERAKVLHALQSAAGFVRHELSPRLGLREVPNLRFMLDDSIERGARVDEILRRIELGEPAKEEDDA